MARPVYKALAQFYATNLIDYFYARYIAPFENMKKRVITPDEFLDIFISPSDHAFYRRFASEFGKFNSSQHTHIMLDMGNGFGQARLVNISAVGCGFPIPLWLRQVPTPNTHYHDFLYEHAAAAYQIDALAASAHAGFRALIEKCSLRQARILCPEIVGIMESWGEGKNYADFVQRIEEIRVARPTADPVLERADYLNIASIRDVMAAVMLASDDDSVTEAGNITLT